MKIKNPSWQNEMADEFRKPYIEKLQDFLKSEYDVKSGKICYPPGPQIFSACGIL